MIFRSIGTKLSSSNIFKNLFNSAKRKSRNIYAASNYQRLGGEGGGVVMGTTLTDGSYTGQIHFANPPLPSIIPIILDHDFSIDRYQTLEYFFAFFLKIYSIPQSGSYEIYIHAASNYQRLGGEGSGVVMGTTLTDGSLTHG